MFRKIIRFFILILFSALTIQVNGQNEYSSEIGLVGGGAFYTDDANLYENNSPLYGLMYRYKIHPRFAARAELNNTTVQFNYQSELRRNTVNTLDVMGEFNFFDIDYKQYKPFSRKSSPYIFAGAGMAMFAYENANVFELSFPVGVGYKISLGERFNLSAQITERIVMSDRMEGIPELNNPKLVNGSNFLNNDMMTTYTISLTYNIFRKKCDCIRY